MNLLAYRDPDTARITDALQAHADLHVRLPFQTQRRLIREHVSLRDSGATLDELVRAIHRAYDLVAQEPEYEI